MWCLPCCHLLCHWKHFPGSFIPLDNSRLSELCSWAWLPCNRRSLHGQWHGRLGVSTWARYFLYVILNDILLWSMQFYISVIFEAILCCFTLWFFLVDNINAVVYDRKILFFVSINTVYWRISTTHYFTIDLIFLLIGLFWILSTTLVLLCSTYSWIWCFRSGSLQYDTHTIVEWIWEAVN